jgi:nicotinamide-nucleotide adenylyltransferase
MQFELLLLQGRQKDLKKVRRGLFIGRFQPPHKGHLEAIKSLMEKVNELIIIIGSTQLSHDLTNPFTTGERFLMLKSALDEEKIDPLRYLIIPVPDAKMHSIWVSQILAYTPTFDVVFTNEPLTKRLFEEANIAVAKVRFYQRKVYSATEVRRRILADENWEVLLSKAVVEIIKEIDGVNRIKELAMTDSPFGRKKNT